MAEETTCGQIENSVCVMPYYKYFDIPGIDFLGSMLNWKNDGLARSILILTVFIILQFNVCQLLICRSISL